MTVTSSEIELAAAVGDNYSCDIFGANIQVTVDGRRSTLSLIVKSVPEKGEMSKVNILLCAMLHVRDIRSVLNSNTLSILWLHIYHVHIRLYFSQIRRTTLDLIIV